VPTLEGIVFQAGRDALADQDSVVTGIRQRTRTLLATHALVASFLGAPARSGYTQPRIQLRLVVLLRRAARRSIVLGERSLPRRQIDA
jgi:hypothetical protein